MLSQVLQTIFSEPRIPMLVLGVFFILVKVFGTLRGKKKPLTPRRKSVLWFFQALGFWCLVVGVFMFAQINLPDLFSPDDDDDIPAAATE